MDIHLRKFFFFFWPRHAACEILVAQPGIKPVPPAVEAWNPNHWTAREVLEEILFVENCCVF